MSNLKIKIEVKEMIPENRPEDMKLIIPTYLSIWNHPDNREYLSFTGRVFEETQLREWCSQHLDVGIRYFGAFNSDKHLAGILVTHSSQIEGFELLGIGVEPNQKKRGIGTLLLLRGLEVAHKEMYKAVDGKVFANNARMLCLLISRGFVPVRIEHHRGPNGEDLVHLKKYL